MAIPLKQSTASQEVPLGYFVDSADGNTEKTALSIANTDIKLWKAGATSLANKNSGGATHIANGIYYAVLDATDTDTLGPLVVFVHVAGALTVRLECAVHPAAVYDALYGSATLPADVTKWDGTAVATPATAGYPSVTLKSGTGTGEVSLSSGAVTVGTVNDKTGYALSSAGVDAVLDDAVEGSVTMRGILRAVLAFVAGKASGGGSSPVAYRDQADTKNRISLTVDSNGNRSSVTTDLT